ncbi:MAG: Heimdall-CTERM domain-containing surface protein [Candidatus Thorarchaeota archaeon]
MTIILLLALGLSTFTPTQAAGEGTVLVWSGNGALHVEVDLFKGNASAWGYTVKNSTAQMTASLLTGVDVLILNAPDYIFQNESDVIKTWFNGASDRTIWITSDSDYGGYWYPWGVNATPIGVNHIVKAIGGHVYVQDDAVSDPVSMDGASYRVLANTPNTDDDPAKFINRKIETISMHGPTAVVPYKSVTADGVGTVGKYSSMNKVQWVINSSTTAQIQDQDFDDDTKWEGYPIAKNMSMSMVAIEWDLGTKNNKLVVAGESFFADYKLMFGTECRYANKTGTNEPLPIDNIPFTHQLLDWSVGSLDTSPLTAAPGFEILTVFLAFTVAIAFLKRRR